MPGVCPLHKLFRYRIKIHSFMSIATSVTASCGAGGTLSRDTVGICRVTHMSLAARGPLRLQLVSAAFSIAVSCLVRSTYGPKELQTPVYMVGL